MAAFYNGTHYSVGRYAVSLSSLCDLPISSNSSPPQAAVLASSAPKPLILLDVKRNAGTLNRWRIENVEHLYRWGILLLWSLLLCAFLLCFDFYISFMRALEVSFVLSLILLNGNIVSKDGNILKYIPFPTEQMTCPEWIFIMNEQVSFVHSFPTEEIPGEAWIRARG